MKVGSTCKKQKKNLKLRKCHVLKPQSLESQSMLERLLVAGQCRKAKVQTLTPCSLQLQSIPRRNGGCPYTLQIWSPRRTIGRWIIGYDPGKDLGKSQIILNQGCAMFGSTGEYAAQWPWFEVRWLAYFLWVPYTFCFVSLLFRVSSPSFKFPVKMVSLCFRMPMHTLSCLSAVVTASLMK